MILTPLAGTIVPFREAPARKPKPRPFSDQTPEVTARMSAR